VTGYDDEYDPADDPVDPDGLLELLAGLCARQAVLDAEGVLWLVARGEAMDLHLQAGGALPRRWQAAARTGTAAHAEALLEAVRELNTRWGRDGALTGGDVAGLAAAWAVLGRWLAAGGELPADWQTGTGRRTDTVATRPGLLLTPNVFRITLRRGSGAARRLPHPNVAPTSPNMFRVDWAVYGESRETLMDTTTATVNYDQTAAHLAAFDYLGSAAGLAARYDALAAMAAHMTGDHGWTLLGDEPADAATLTAMHHASHNNEAAARADALTATPLSAHAHYRAWHTCHYGPLCATATATAADDGPTFNDDGTLILCGHPSCEEQVMGDLCYPCQEEAMTGTSEADPIWCATHGWTWVTDAGSNGGFAGEGFWWVNWACGCGTADAGAYNG